jgi:hypothetical protein
MTDMYEEEGVDFDPITALATVNSARERFVEADKAQDEAIEARRVALEQLDSAQYQFDKVAAYLRAHAPVGSRWWHNRHNRHSRETYQD